VAINCAGIANATPAEDMPLEQWQRMMDINLTGVFLSCQAEARVMLPRKSGSIVNIASMSGVIVNRGLTQAHYNSSKAAVIHLTHSVAMELGESGVRVNCICPGGIATPIFGKGYGLSPEAADRTVPLMKQALAGMQPLQRAGLPEDIANAAAWLASDESSFVNGHALVVDGGLIGGRLWSEGLQRREALQAAMRSLAG